MARQIAKQSTNGGARQVGRETAGPITHYTAGELVKVPSFLGAIMGAEGRLLCGGGHLDAWYLKRRVGTRLDLFCAAVVAGEDGRQRRCMARATAYLGLKLGFQGGRPSNVWRTKAWLLALLADGEWRTVSDLATLCLLTGGQLRGAVRRNLEAGYIEKSPEKAFVFPSHAGWAYRITGKGLLWLQGAKRAGLIEQ
ncbi:MAG: hypothetical protein HYU30_10545 [Chloroflexi bacterium]|nr:hypothetical protein [Chloroflexota bacterium]